MSRLLVASTRMSSATGFLPPTRSTSRSCSTRSSLACSPSGISEISSSSRVPPLACSNLPGLRRLGAGEGALLVAEQGGFEQVVGNRRAVDGDEGPPAAPTARGCSARRPPCPRPTRRSAARWRRSRPRARRAQQRRASAGLRRPPYPPAPAARHSGAICSSSVFGSKGLSMKSQAPPRIAATALSTSPKAVISSTGSPGWRLRISPSTCRPSIGSCAGR
jgi:hypothetical protein